MAFVNSLVSYLMLMIVFVIVGAIAIFGGITLRKRADAKAAMTVQNADVSESDEPMA